ncbi:hypothetical protein GIB67_040985 [Kingdonia uniflora]|uniref:Uncharacterized protein n=1 Tax=Kingdonia uniflora TaxID=39325 RepID=A0A7J7NCC3_9MAGN|nr:hypothetical protein GIB67_040985 [Kingdonia uniflora]
MTGVGSNKKTVVDREMRVVLLKASRVNFTDVPESTMSSKLAWAIPKKRMLKCGSTSGTTGSDKVEGGAKKRRVNPPSQLTRVKASEDGLDEEGGLKVVEDRAAYLMKGIYLGMEEKKAKLEKGKAEFEKKVAHLKAKLAREGKQVDSLKAFQEVEINELTAEAEKKLGEVVIQRNRLGRHLLKMEYSKTDVNDIMADTYIEEEEDDEAENIAVGITNEDKEDQHVKRHFKFAEVTQTADDLTRKIEEKNAKISKGQKELAKTKEKTTKLKGRNEAMMVNSREAGMARYPKQTLETSKKELRHFVASLKDQMIRKMNEQGQTRANLLNTRSKLERLKNKMTEKDSCNDQILRGTLACLRTLAEDKVWASYAGIGDKGLKKVKDFGSPRWLYNSILRGKLDATADSHSDTDGVKFTVERKESLLDKVTEEETELELVLKGLDLSRKKRVDSSSALPNPVKPSKVAQKYLKKQMLKALPASGTTGSGEVAKDMRRRVEPSGDSGEKVAEGRSASMDDLKEVEERVRLAVLQGEDDMSKMVAHLFKGIWLGIEEEKRKLKKVNVELEKELARSRADALKDVKQLKASHAMVIGQMQVETKANLDEMVEERYRLGCHLMFKGYSEEEVDAIKADT